MQHPVYGGGVIEPGFRPIPGFDGYEVNEMSQVRGKLGTILIPNSDFQVTLCVYNKKKMMTVYRLSLMTFFSHIAENDTVDHIDGNFRNNHITNLQWMSIRDNVRKSNFGSPNNSGVVRSKAVWLLDGRCGTRVRRFDSTYQAASIIGEIKSVHISQSARSGGRISARGHFFEYEAITDFPGEEWRTSEVLDRVLGQTHKPDHKKIKVSNFGRWKTCSGSKTHGSVSARVEGNKYSYARVNNRNFLVHQLIFMGWYNQLAPSRDTVDADGKKVVICHDDFAPLREDGRYRNWACDLSLGTQSENALSSHEARRKRAREEENEEECSVLESEIPDI